jgi:riboflavin synthase
VFTGLVAELGEVTLVDRTDGGVRLGVRGEIAGELHEGDSVAVSGVCLTAAAIAPDGFEADVMAETLRRCTLGDVQAGDPVNLELPLRATDRLGGHVVQGHVDGLGTVLAADDDGFARRLRIAAEPALLRYVVEKGSIAVEGVSLTVSALDERDFTVSLVPETLARTSLGTLSPGAHVNLEVDLLAKYVERLVAR